MQIINSRNQYGTIAIFFHWIMAIIMMGLIIIGLYMTRIPISPWRLKLYGLHKEWGTVALILAALRITWRMSNKVPMLALPAWEKFAAYFVHWSFYFLMFTLPLSGLLLTAASGLPASFFGLFLMPTLIAPNESSRYFFTQVHDVLSYVLIAFICLHTLAALKHHFINKDDILRRML